ncbi:S9 family peptidase [Aliidiomarina sanyensis]|uniref:S9 family peptidase n=1 Tax=Aliidiomarina sanyensis TaxID=1249555 RepID=A0A432WRM3_9GAMM|nr:S9 family peptidase [Aliidiomarina sanyensis]RUO36424.1 S9 family peptidase [Aliidiomarina sanyensis]
MKKECFSETTKSWRATKHIALAVLMGSGALGAIHVQATENNQRAIVAEDYYQMVFLGDLALSPNGEHLAFVKTTTNQERTGRKQTLWLQRGTDEPFQFTRHEQDFAPRFSPDGRYLIFLSGRDNGTALYRIAMAGGEAAQVLKLEQGSISDVQWHPDGSELLLNIRVKPDVDDPRQKAEDKGPQPNISVITEAVYKRQGGYLNEARSGLWHYSLTSHELTSITGDTDWHENGAQYSPSGDCVAYQSNRHELAHEGYFNSRIYIRCGDDETTVPAPEGWAGNPIWITDDQLAFVYRAEQYAAPNVKLFDQAQNETRILSAEMDHSPSELTYHQGALWFIADDRGSRPLFRLALDGSGYQRVRGVGDSMSDLVMAKNASNVAWVEENEVTAPRVVTAADAEASANIITQFNDALVAELDLARYEVISAENERGDVLDVFFLRPKGWQDGDVYPLILNIKGGPGGMWGHQWFPEKQLMRARGYAVAFVNYRGSSGYGHDFADQVRLDYGGADFRDNMVAVDAVLDTHIWIDTDRLYVTGGSHGGFLTNWITTQTDRFRAAVTQRSVSNWISEAGTQAFPPLSMITEFGGTIWENYDYYWGRSPLKYADQVTAPTLIIHSTDDHITPIGQGEEWFYALKANNVPVEMVIFHGEGHGLSRNGRPINLVERLNRIVDWFDRHNPAINGD